MGVLYGEIPDGRAVYDGHDDEADVDEVKHFHDMCIHAKW